jgi:hypothetical protein
MSDNATSWDTTPALSTNATAAPASDTARGGGEVSIIGRGEIIDDYDLVHSFFLRRAHTNARVASGEWTTEQFMKMACSTNRRLIRVVREKVFSLDMTKLPWSDDDF